MFLFLLILECLTGCFKKISRNYQNKMGPAFSKEGISAAAEVSQEILDMVRKACIDHIAEELVNPLAKGITLPARLLLKETDIIYGKCYVAFEKIKFKLIKKITLKKPKNLEEFKEYPSITEIEDLIARYIKHKGNKNLFDMKIRVSDDEHYFLLHFAAMRPFNEGTCLLSKLIEEIRVNIVPDSENRTALHVAVQFEQLGNVNYLLNEKNKDKFSKEDVMKGGFLPVHLAIFNKNTGAIFDLLFDKENPNPKNTESGLSSLHYAVIANNENALKKILDNLNQNSNCTDHHGRTPLHFAFAARNYEFCSILIKKIGTTIEVLEKDNSKLTWLHYLSCSKAFKKYEKITFDRIYGEVNYLKVEEKSKRDEEMIFGCWKEEIDENGFQTFCSIAEDNEIQGQILNYPQVLTSYDERNYIPICYAVLFSDFEMFNILLSKIGDAQIQDTQKEFNLLKAIYLSEETKKAMQILSEKKQEIFICLNNQKDNLIKHLKDNLKNEHTIYLLSKLLLESNDLNDNDKTAINEHKEKLKKYSKDLSNITLSEKKLSQKKTEITNIKNKIKALIEYFIDKVLIEKLERCIQEEDENRFIILLDEVFQQNKGLKRFLDLSSQGNDLFNDIKKRNPNFKNLIFRSVKIPALLKILYILNKQKLELDEKDQSPLFHAIFENNLESIKIIKNLSSDEINLKNNDNKTSLDFAIEFTNVNNYGLIISELLSFPTIESKIKSKAFIYVLERQPNNLENLEKFLNFENENIASVLEYSESNTKDTILMKIINKINKDDFRYNNDLLNTEEKKAHEFLKSKLGDFFKHCHYDFNSIKLNDVIHLLIKNNMESIISYFLVGLKNSQTQNKINQDTIRKIFNFTEDKNLLNFGLKTHNIGILKSLISIIKPTDNISVDKQFYKSIKNKLNNCTFNFNYLDLLQKQLPLAICN